MTEIRTLQLLRLATALSLLFVLINHLLPPNLFAGSQLLFDYDQGFVRRGLAGEVLGYWLGQSVSLTELYLTSAILTVLASLVFYFFLIRNLGDRLASYLLVILVLESFAFASFVGSAGYLDAVLLVLALLAMSSDATTGRGLILRGLLCALGVLIHENMLPYFTVLIGFDIWLSRGARQVARWPALLPVAVGLAAVLVLGLFGEHDAQQAAIYLDNLKARAEFDLHPGVDMVVNLTLTDNFDFMKDMRAQGRYWNWMLFDGLPLFLMSLWLIWLNLKLLGKSADGLTKILCIGSIFAPLSLNIIAFDIVRFGVMSVLVGFIITALLVQKLPEARDRLKNHLSWPVFVILLVLNANVFTMQINTTATHTAQFPWVLVSHINWLIR